MSYISNTALLFVPEYVSAADLSTHSLRYMVHCCKVLLLDDSALARWFLISKHPDEDKIHSI